MAGSAGAPTLTELEAEVDADIQARVDATEAEFRAKYPRTFAALDAWRAAEGDEGEQPTGLRIKSKIEGFRRAGIAHSKATVDHPLETFAGRHEGERVGLARLEMLFAEPNLVVELI
ncbi:MAG: hypothetical protein E5V28_30895 [Mesorhizobium sp.]|nr:MAG: hypothetical protein E5V28_30895 [Mesorhizobium sp.]